jgi:ferrochelatase
MTKTAVLVMAYGTPNSLAEVEPYYTDIRGGRRPSPELLQQLTARYARIGGRTPLNQITRAQAHALSASLGSAYCVYVGMKHWHPFIGEAVQEIARAGHRRVIALALAPHYSRASIGGYIQRVKEAAAGLEVKLDISYIESWNDHPLYISSLCARMDQTRSEFDVVKWNELHVVFTAHSLPARILADDDPYPQELRETCELVAERLGLFPADWSFAYQSAGRTGDEWLGPDVLETLDDLAAEGKRRVLIAPIGFVADHLEILYDLDVECADRARVLGLEMRRIPSANASPLLVATLDAIVRACG